MADLDETVKGDMCFGDDAEVPDEPVEDGSVMVERICGTCRFWEGGQTDKRAACSVSWEWPPTITRRTDMCGKWIGYTNG